MHNVGEEMYAKEQMWKNSYILTVQNDGHFADKISFPGANVLVLFDILLRFVPSVKPLIYVAPY